MPSAMGLPVGISRCQELTRNANSDNGTPRQNVSDHFMYYITMKDSTTAVQHPPKAHHGLPTTRWFRPSNFDKHSCPYVGQWSNDKHRGHFQHDLRSTTFASREKCMFSSRVITNGSSSKPCTTRHTSNRGCNLPILRPHAECVF